MSPKETIYNTRSPDSSLGEPWRASRLLFRLSTRLPGSRYLLGTFRMNSSDRLNILLSLCSSLECSNLNAPDSSLEISGCVSLRKVSPSQFKQLLVSIENALWNGWTGLSKGIKRSETRVSFGFKSITRSKCNECQLRTKTQFVWFFNFIKIF